MAENPYLTMLSTQFIYSTISGSLNCVKNILEIFFLSGHLIYALLFIPLCLPLCM